jgi:hypothetical protein
MFAIKIIHGLSWPRWHDTSINIYFCSQYISLIKPKLYSFTMDATRGTGTAYPYRASDFNHVKIVWVLDNLAFLSFDFECT